MSTTYPLRTVFAGLLGAVSALASTACPGSVERKHDGASTGAVVASPPRLDPPGSSPPVPAPAPEPKISVLSPGEALSADTLAADAEVPALEMVFDIRVIDLPPPPAAWGSIESAVLAVRNGQTSSLRVWLGAGRLRARVVHRAFALEDGWELRARADLVGMVLFLPAQKSRRPFRVVPPGAVRSLLNERRLDVLPLAPSTVQDLGRIQAFARQGRRAHIETSYGTLELEQVYVSKQTPLRSSGPSAIGDGGLVTRHGLREPTRDAGEAGTTTVPEPTREGAGEALCRLWLELIASERAVFGAPCDPSMVPVRAEIHFATGGGLSIQARQLREIVQSGAELAFPPEGAQPLDAPLPPVPTTHWTTDEAMIGMRTRGEPTMVEIVNQSAFPRLASLDGVVVANIAPNQNVFVRTRAGRYLLAFRTLLGEVTEPNMEIDAPSRTSTRQLGSAPPPPPSAIASARNGP